MDSCHAFAAGYDIREMAGIKRLSGEIGKHIGFKAVKLIHLNDSKGEAGSRIDRHEHIGKGKIGLGALKNFITYKPFLDIPIVLETPKRNNDDDIENLSTVKTMLAR
jgi:deoxyribonuclease-4